GGSGGRAGTGGAAGAAGVAGAAGGGGNGGSGDDDDDGCGCVVVGGTGSPSALAAFGTWVALAAAWRRRRLRSKA
ncbi:MAG TPA: hypothetical protein VFS00_00150, partial [Polyangiaceae bacterium]|nr:hypothetical protein [Polyangiaceae bacterium]